MSYPGYELNQYQQDAMRTAGDRKDDLACHALGVAGEAGEVADLFKKVLFHGHALDKEKAAKELGDVLWYVAILAQRIGYSLSDVAEMNVEKLRKRYPNGFSSERSQNRKGE
jgi:NTP pyrophosphatase (non-canonical NTP hydrolase)